MEQQAGNPIRILIADDHPVVRDGLVAMLGTQLDFKVIAEAASGQETVTLALKTRPDIILLDLEMPGMDGVQALEQLHTRLPETHTIVFTAFDTDERILKALKMGAQGYLLKGSPRQELFNAIRTVSQGGSLLQPPVASKVLEYLRSSQSDTSAPASQELTERERQVMRLVAMGKLNKEIAVELGISERTVKFHVSIILRKLNAANRIEAVKKAAHAGLINF